MEQAGEYINVRMVRPPVGITIRGDIAEVWRGEAQIGLLYQWTLHGANGDWQGDALKYRLKDGGDSSVDLRLFLHGPSGAIEIQAQGHIISDVEPDGELHRTAVKLKGTRLEVA